VIGRVAARAAIAGILLALNGTASAQAIYPSKPVRLIVPYAPGGGTSVVSRLLGQKLSELWKYQVIVDNRPGGNTIIGSELMVKSPPDGYTLLFVTSTHTINPALLKTPYDAIKDFAPVSTATRSPFMLVVHPSLPVKNLREFIALAKSRPGQLDYASSGTATAPHLALEVFSMAAGIRMHHIPYKGGGPALIDLMGGQVQVHLTAPPNLIPNIRNGRIKGLAVTGDNRLAALPELPTFSEAGLPSFNLTNWNGFLAPADTPRAFIDKIAADIAKVLQLSDIRDQLVAQGQNGWASGPEQFAALIRSEVAIFAKVVKAVGITAN
jgi:tripartite-type tricarboxylate transporter receptor subunit TctC